MSGLVVGDPDVARIWTSGLQGGVEELGREDWTRFTFLMRDYFLVFESVFMQHRLGSATDELFESRMETLRRFLQTAGGVRAWREVEHGFSRSYREHVAENILR